jgi:hypothetical protein
MNVLLEQTIRSSVLKKTQAEWFVFIYSVKCEVWSYFCPFLMSTNSELMSIRTYVY